LKHRTWCHFFWD